MNPQIMDISANCVGPASIGLADPIPARTVVAQAALERNRAATTILAPCAGAVTRQFVRPGSLVAAGDPLLQLAPTDGTIADPAGLITAPVAGRLAKLASVGTHLELDGLAGSLLGGFIAETLTGPDAGAFEFQDVVGAKITCDGTSYPATVASIVGEGHTRRVRLAVADVANALSAGMTVAVMLTIQPTPAMVEAEVAARLEAWPYVLPPRGNSLVQLGLASPRSTAWERPVSKPQNPNPFIHRRPNRESGPYVPPASPERKPRASHRHVLTLPASVWRELAIATTPVRAGTIAVHVDLTARLVREPAPVQDFAVTAPVSGLCRMARNFLPRDLVRAGDPIAFITLDPQVVDLQADFLAAPDHAAVHTQLRDRLRFVGLREPELRMLSRTGRVLTEIAVDAPIDGLVEEATGGGTVSHGTTIVRLRGANTDYLVCNLEVSDLAKLPPRVVVRLRAASSNPATFMSPLLEVSIDPSNDRAGCRIPLPAGVIGAPVPDRMDLRLEDPATRRDAVLVPETCLHQVARSTEALVHIGPGQLRPVSVTMGLSGDGFVEITDGLAGHETLVQDLTDLATERDELRAILLGFWKPPGSGPTVRADAHRF